MFNGIFRSKLGVSAFYLAVGFFTKLRIHKLISAFGREDEDEWKLPEYPELVLEEE